MKRGTPEHPKVIEFASLLNIPRYAAVGILECLWHFTAEYAPRGDIGKFSDRAIAKACYWKGEASRFVNALIEAQLLCKVDEVICKVDYPPPCPRLLVWDWSDHADDYTRKKLQRKGLTFFDVRKCPDNSRLPVPVPVPMPAPEPKAAPSQTPPTAPPKPSGREPAGYAMDEQYTSFRKACEWLSLIPSDFAGEAWRAWSHLDFEQRSAAIAGIQALEAAGADPALVKRPKRWLADREWLRPPPKPPKSRRGGIDYDEVLRMD